MGKSLTLFIAAGLLLLGCEKEKDFGPIYMDQVESSQSPKANRLIVGCEGNFQLSNASLYSIDIENEQVEAEVFKSVNENSIGDVLQSVYHMGDTIVTVINNSGIIRFLNDSTYQEIAFIDDLTSPRYVMMVGGLLWVTDLYSNQITVIDLSSLTIQNTIPFNGWSERIVLFHDQILVANITESSVYVFDKLGNKKDEIKLDFEPTFMFAVDEDLIIAGNNHQENVGRISKYNSALYPVELKKLSQKISVMSVSDDAIYTLDKKTLIERSISDFKIKNEAVIDVVTPYGMIVSTSTDMIYVADAKDYISRGEVLEISTKFMKIENRFSVGNIPQSMIFTLEYR